MLRYKKKFKYRKKEKKKNRKEKYKSIKKDRFVLLDTNQEKIKKYANYK